ncbi:MAG: nucleotidyl transferase AbiEii/AbiGii toxin family protein [Chitinophagaceae bacterium]|nr:MAG: nucleotidyl transferase AbiEii/AbiGii toxin family protein [Chitinophagaceae bacterium]
MKLHESSQDFKDAIEATAQALKLRPVFVEKDYWVTYVLKNLSKSQFANQVVFKGGTSLSKAYGCIKRFSEDIDLAILNPADYSGGQVKGLLKTITQNIAGNLTEISNHAATKKFGKIRATVYSYPKVIKDANYGVVSDNIQIEINSMANPVPYVVRPIRCYIAQYLESAGLLKEITDYELEQFDLQVLSLQRTYFEKVLSVNRLSYDLEDGLVKKVRHFYDIHQLHHHPELAGNILTQGSFPILNDARTDDEENRTMDGAWKGQLLGQSPLFTDIEATWQKVNKEYRTGLQDLLWEDEAPSPEAIQTTLGEIKVFVEDFDKHHPPQVKTEAQKDEQPTEDKVEE